MKRRGSPPKSLPTLFVDRSLGGKTVPNALRAAGATIELLDEHFAPDTPDTEWLAYCGERRWIVLSKDKRIAIRESERLALERARVIAVILTSGDVTGEEVGEILVRALDKIHRLPVNERPAIYQLGRDGVPRPLAARKKGKNVTPGVR